jgi:GR25 family glycosyltransferase involved in LPS biosynthesis
VLDAAGSPLTHRVTRVSAVDASEHHDHPREGLVEGTYTLGDQLFVDPHPLASPERLNLDERIDMSPQEVAIACSHISVWRRIASGSHEYAMVLEDDVWFHPRFARVVDKAWSDLVAASNGSSLFDILYVSYREVDQGAEKVSVSPSLFAPFRGLWYLSGYVLSRQGARKLLGSLPVRGPVDLWMNHQFGRLNVYGTVKEVIKQRPDEKSSNCYSILPVLSRTGILNTEKPGLFAVRPTLGPVFAFGPSGSGLSSLAMALSMLGYRCCSDVDRLPIGEMQRLLRWDPSRIFDAYVNVASLEGSLEQLARLYPHGRLILTQAGLGGATEVKLPSRAISRSDLAHDNQTMEHDSDREIREWPSRTLILASQAPRIWKALCEFLRCVPPPSPYPSCQDRGHRLLSASANDVSIDQTAEIHRMQFDDSPWVAPRLAIWRGMPCVTDLASFTDDCTPVEIVDDSSGYESSLWRLRDDTFPGNLALFRPSNFCAGDGKPAQIHLRKEDCGVRSYSSAALSSRMSFLYGRFEAVLKPSRVPGVVTGLFLHRDSPRQEIDIEFVGRRPRQMLTNVYYNPGSEGARFDYGYRGSPILVDLGFDASAAFHSYAIEWSPSSLRWYVDGRLVHQRANWEPTPIPHLPMRFHLNLWPCRSRQLAGKLRDCNLPTACSVMSIRLKGSRAEDMSTSCDNEVGNQRGLTNVAADNHLSDATTSQWL